MTPLERALRMGAHPKLAAWAAEHARNAGRVGRVRTCPGCRLWGLCALHGRPPWRQLSLFNETQKGKAHGP